MQSEETTFGARLRRYRERAGLTHEALAERAGASVSAISALERGRRRRPYPHTVVLLAEALELTREEHAEFAALASPRGERGDASSPAMQPWTPASNLPAPGATLIGREHDMDALAELVPAHPGRLVTLIGAGGAGKTRLALAVAEKLRGVFAQNVVLVELASLTDPTLVPVAVAAVLGIPELAGAPPIEQLAAALQNRRLLLVLDNCEQLIDACAALAERLLAACPDVFVLATSQEPLRLARERRWRVPPLAAPALDEAVTLATVADYSAVQLFVARARAVVPDFDPTDENHVPIARICARLGGLPLSLELAAARVQVLTTHQIMERLDDAIRLLTSASRAAPTRQQTLRATLEWSYALLTPSEQAVLRRLAVCVDGCEIEAAEAICSAADVPDEDVLDLLSRLVDRSLVLVSEVAGVARYGLLEPVRQFALSVMPDEERQAARAHHAAAYEALVQRAAAAIHGPDQAGWLLLLEREFGNLRAALSWMTAAGEVERALRFAVTLSPFWEARGHLEEGRRWIRNLLGARADGDIPAGLHADALVAAGRLAYWQKQLNESATLLGVALAEARRHDDRRLIAEALAYLGAVYGHQGAFAEGAPLLEESLTLSRAEDDRVGIALGLLTLGVTTSFLGDHAGAVAMVTDSVTRYRRLGDHRWTAIALTMLGGVVLRAGDPERAAGYLREGLAGHVAIGDRGFMVSGLDHMAAGLVARGRVVEAARVLGTMAALSNVLATTLSTVTEGIVSQIEAAVRGRLSASEYLAAWNEGHSLPLHEVVSRLLQEEPSEQSAAPPLLAEHAPDRPRALPESLTSGEPEGARLLPRG